MNSIATSIVIIPGLVALLLCLLFSYLYQQSRQAYFRAWQIAWACYSIHYALDAFRYYRPPAPAAFFASSLFSDLLFEAETNSAQRAGRSSKPTPASFLRPSLRHPSRLP